MNQRFRIKLPTGCKVTVLYHSLEIAVPTKLQSDQDSNSGAAVTTQHFEVKLPATSTAQVIHTDGEFAVEIVSGEQEPYGDLVTSIYSQPVSCPPEDDEEEEP